jgi:hypothetical protein
MNSPDWVKRPKLGRTGVLAFHEAGHAVISRLCPICLHPAEFGSFVAIVTRPETAGRWLGRDTDKIIGAVVCWAAYR